MVRTVDIGSPKFIERVDTRHTYKFLLLLWLGLGLTVSSGLYYHMYQY